MNSEEFQLHVVSELASLKTHILALVGNGQPGRISLLEHRVLNNEREITRGRGIIKGISIATGILWAVASGVMYYWKHH